MSDTENMAERALREAQEAYRTSSYDRTVALAKEALEANGDAASRLRLLLLLAAAYDELGGYESALAALKDALDLDPDSVGAWNNLGIICRKIGKPEEAVAAFEQAYARDPGNAGILINLGSLALKRSDPAEAKRLLERALEIDSTHPAAHANLALTLAIFGRLEEAEESLRLAVLHGFDGGEAIQTRIDKLKAVRGRILQDNRAPDPDASSDGSIGAGEEDSGQQVEIAELLALLERELHRLAARRARERRTGEGRTGEGRTDIAGVDASGRELVSRMNMMRKQIRALRASLGLPEEADSDTIDGQNILTEETA